MDSSGDGIHSVQQVIDCLCGYAVRGYGRQCRVKQIIGEHGSVSAECCFQILNSVEIEHPVGKILLDCVSSFHHKHGCSVRTLLCMIAVWYRCHQSLRQQGLTVKEVRLLLERLLDISIPLLYNQSADVSSLLIVRQRPGDARPSPPALHGHQLSQSDAQIITSSKTRGDDEDVSWDEVSWYFTHDSADTSTDTSPLPPALNKVAVANNSHAEDSDDEFASCFDSVATQPAPTPKHNYDDISWLNNALKSVLLGNSSLSHQSALKRSTVYSHNLASNSTDQPAPLMDQSDQRGTSSNQSSADAIPSANTPSNNCSSLDSLLEGIARYDNLVYDLLLKSVNFLLSNGERLQADHIDNINIIECVGPLSHKSDVYSGLVVTCHADALELCARQSNFKAVLFQGDVDPTYTHRGYQNAVKAKLTLSVSEMSSDTNSQSWLAGTYDAVYKANVSCLLMKGRCETTLKTNLMLKGVLVLELVSYAVLKCISEQCQVPILHYTSDIGRAYSCELQVAPMDLQTHSKLMGNLVRLCLPDTAVAVTAVVCSATVGQTQVYGERLRHALARLKNIATTGLCTIDMSMNSMAREILEQTGNSTENSLMSEAGEQFVKHLLCIVTTPAEVSQRVDDTDSLVAAWKSSLSAVTYLTSLSSIVTVGLLDHTDHVS